MHTRISFGSIAEAGERSSGSGGDTGGHEQEGMKETETEEAGGTQVVQSGIEERRGGGRREEELCFAGALHAPGQLPTRDRRIT